MRSPADDRTARAAIRDEALRLFAERNADAVTIRQIAAAAGVSPALVLRHYGSKEGLQAAVDERVLATFEAMLRAVTTADAARLDPGSVPSLAEQLAAHLPADSPIPAYLARMLLTGGTRGSALFARLYALSRQAVGRLVAAEAATDGGDAPARAAFLLANDLAVIMLRERLHEVLGVDPLSAEGLGRWSRQVLAIYGGGLSATTPPGRP